jgi:addiction module HigA family antidote
LSPGTPRFVSAPAGIRARVPWHPGRFLQRHFLLPLALNQTAAAKRLGVSRRRLHELVHGKRGMSPDTAIRCAQSFGLSAADWLAMQSAWDAWATWHQMRGELRLHSRRVPSCAQAAR